MHVGWQSVVVDVKRNDVIVYGRLAAEECVVYGSSNSRREKHIFLPSTKIRHKKPLILMCLDDLNCCNGKNGQKIARSIL